MTVVVDPVVGPSMGSGHQQRPDDGPARGRAARLVVRVVRMRAVGLAGTGAPGQVRPMAVLVRWRGAAQTGRSAAGPGVHDRRRSITAERRATCRSSRHRGLAATGHASCVMPTST